MKPILFLGLVLAFAGYTWYNSTKIEYDADVIVVGGGAAGLAASYTAGKQNLKVILLDKEKRTGGNSAKASSGINAAGTPEQKKHGVDDSVEVFVADTMKSGGYISKPDLVQTLAENSPKAYDFLTGLGVNLEVLSKCGGHSRTRTHRCKVVDKPTNVGFEIVKALQREIASMDNVKVVTNAKVTKLLKSSKGQVYGAEIESTNNEVVHEKTSLTASAIVLASGGYSFADEIINRFEHLKGLPTTNGPWATGDALTFGPAVGAKIIDLEHVQVHPTGLLDPKKPDDHVKILGPESLRASGGVLVNYEGQRFVDELSTRDKVTQAIFDNCKPFPGGKQTAAYLVMTEQMSKVFGEKVWGFYNKRGLVTKFDNIEAGAAHFNLPAAALKRTIETYNKASATGSDEFGKTTFPDVFDHASPIFIGAVTPSIHYTMGGLEMNAKAQILDQNQSPIPGLYGAGEVTGGVHGKNRLAGNSILECVVFGRIAGTSASELAKSS
eukprot:GFYU01004333.1.p1 GENE.GFYU01004333.1~~GFYU01004333.1.p1  ORF type:complete len:514 (-),score=57.08 GFYU01004333.1:35-1522(-)